MTDATSPDPDAPDVARAARGDSEAFGRLVDAHGARLYTLARRIVGRELAEDGVQEVFVRAWERLSQFRGDARFGTWLHRLAVNVLIRQADAAGRLAERMAPLDVEELRAPGTPPDSRVDIDVALTRLGPRLREVVVLHDIEGYGHEEIADTLAISVSASKMRLHRGRMLLREWLAP